MDSGAHAEGEDLDDDFDVAQPLSPEQAVWVMDQLMCREVGISSLQACTRSCFRSRGNKAIRYHKPCLRRYISTTYYGRTPNRYTRLILYDLHTSNNALL